MRNTPQLALFGAKGFAAVARTETRHRPDVVAALRCLGVDPAHAETLADATSGNSAGQWVANALRMRNAAPARK